MVEGTIGGFPFRAAFEPGRGLHVDPAMRQAAEDPVTVEITRVGEEPEIRVPPELRQALDAAPKAEALWNDITPIARRDWILWITTAKKEETRLRRIEVACDKLNSGMRRVCCFPGLKWLVKDRAPSGGTWLPLPKE